MITELLNARSSILYPTNVRYFKINPLTSKLLIFSGKVGVHQKPKADFDTWSKSRQLLGWQASGKTKKGFRAGSRDRKNRKMPGKVYENDYTRVQ